MTVLLQVERSKSIDHALYSGRRGQRGASCEWLQRVPGTTAYYSKLKADLVAYRRWLGVPAFFFTHSLNSSTPDLQAAWVVNTARTMGNVVDVWSSVHECEKLTLRPGFPQQPVLETAYYVHTKCDPSQTALTTLAAPVRSSHKPRANENPFVESSEDDGESTPPPKPKSGETVRFPCRG